MYLLGIIMLFSNTIFSTHVDVYEDADFAPSIEIVDVLNIYNLDFERQTPNSDWLVETEYYDDGGITRRYFNTQGDMVAIEILFPESDDILAPFSGAPILGVHDRIYRIMVQHSNIEWYYRDYRVQFQYHIRSASKESYFVWMWVSLDTSWPGESFPPGLPRPVFVLNADRGRTIHNRHTAWATFSLPLTFPHSTEARLDWTINYGERVSYVYSTRWIR